MESEGNNKNEDHFNNSGPENIFKRRYESILKNAADIVITVDNKGNFTSISESVKGLTGWERDDFVGRDMNYRFVHPDHRLEASKKFHEMLETHDPSSIEFKFKCKDGDYRWFHQTHTPIVNDDDELIEVLVIARDIHERKTSKIKLEEYKKHLERLVKKRTEKLDEANKELEIFSYSLAHDLKAPLRAVQRYSEIILDGKECLDEEQREMLRRIIAATEKMDRLINDIMVYSKVGRKDVLINHIDLEDVIDRVLENLKGNIEEKDADIDVILPLGTVMANEPLLLQSLSNLISNSLKFVEGGEKPKIKIYSENDGQYTKLYISDEGIGIDKENKEKIFQLLTRLHGEETYPGTGIGLSVAKKAVELMNADIGVESERGKGSKFWIRLDKGGG
ncbi:MAG: PAS domain S-box protein [Thermoplasmata archaeon]